MSQDVTLFTAGQLIASQDQGLEAGKLKCSAHGHFAVFLSERNQQRPYLEACTGTA